MLEALRRDYPEVIFDGQQSATETSRLVTSARALVMPSRYPEPFGLVAGEALWSGLPVVLGDTALMANEIVARGAGLACNVRDEVALAKAFRRLLDQDAEARHMSINAFESTRDLGTTPTQWLDAMVDTYVERAARSH